MTLWIALIAIGLPLYVAGACIVAKILNRRLSDHYPTYDD